MDTATFINQIKDRAQNINWRDAIIVPALVIAIITASFIPVVQPSRALAVSDETVTAYTNKERIKHGLNPLVYDKTLERAALAKAEDMISKNYFAHYHDGVTPWDFIISSGEDDWHFAGENLAKNYQDVAQLMNDWMNSELHRNNILNKNYEHIGVAVVTLVLENGETVKVTVQMFTGA